MTNIGALLSKLVQDPATLRQLLNRGELGEMVAGLLNDVPGNSDSRGGSVRAYQNGSAVNNQTSIAAVVALAVLAGCVAVVGTVSVVALSKEGQS
jgi:hypothetical protein